MKTIAIYHADADYVAKLLPQFQQALPNHRVAAWSPDLSANYLITWKPEKKTFCTPGLTVILFSILISLAKCTTGLIYMVLSHTKSLDF